MVPFLSSTHAPHLPSSRHSITTPRVRGRHPYNRSRLSLMVPPANPQPFPSCCSFLQRLHNRDRTNQNKTSVCEYISRLRLPCCGLRFFPSRLRYFHALPASASQVRSGR